jgi:hypothetical protein
VIASSLGMLKRLQVVVPGPLAGNPHLVEAGGQHIPRLSKRAGLCLHPRRSGERVDAERVIQLIESAWILVLAPGPKPSASL